MPRFLELVAEHAPVGRRGGAAAHGRGRGRSERRSRRASSRTPIGRPHRPAARAVGRADEHRPRARGHPGAGRIAPAGAGEEVDALAAAVFLQHFLECPAGRPREPSGEPARASAWSPLAGCSSCRGCAGTEYARRAGHPPARRHLRRVTDTLAAHGVIASRRAVQADRTGAGRGPLGPGGRLRVSARYVALAGARRAGQGSGGLAEVHRARRAHDPEVAALAPSGSASREDSVMAAAADGAAASRSWASRSARSKAFSGRRPTRCPSECGAASSCASWRRISGRAGSPRGPLGSTRSA